MDNTVLVAVSGGVDSAVAVEELRAQGYTVGGVVMRMSPAHDIAVEQANAVAEVLDFPLFVEDCTALFEEKVITPFVSEYLAGRTPNPCIFCNPAVKFHILAAVADREGYQWIATGHYAKVEHTQNGALLKRGEDLSRDQSYMLYRLDQPILQRLLLPLAELPKQTVREKARLLNLPCAEQPDSQEICFLPNGDYASFITERVGEQSGGELIAPDGTVCGHHNGILHYTIGQRKHLGVALGRPVFVDRIDPQTNRVYLVDFGNEWRSSVTITDMVSVSGVLPTEAFPCQGKIRSQAKPADAVCTPSENEWQINFTTPQRAPAPGQSVVLYQNDTVLSGGYCKESF